jgi:hypothetical protein
VVFVAEAVVPGPSAAELGEAGIDPVLHAAVEAVESVRSGQTGEVAVVGSSGVLVLAPVDAFSDAAYYAFPAHHGVRDQTRTVAARESALLAHRTEAAAAAQKGVDTFRVEDVLTWKFPDYGGGDPLSGLRGDEIIETDGAGGL